MRKQVVNSRCFTTRALLLHVHFGAAALLSMWQWVEVKQLKAAECGCALEILVQVQKWH